MPQKQADPPIGEAFGRLTVIGVGPMTVAKRPRITWKCLCSCGTTCNVQPGNLVSGSTRSCGCFRTEFGNGPNFKHGQSRGGNVTPTYYSWTSMKERCRRPRRHNAANYTAKGITVCDRWLNSFEAFLADMGDRPEGMTLDRIDGDKGYSPENCRWATPKEQAANRTY